MARTDRNDNARRPGEGAGVISNGTKGDDGNRHGLSTIQHPRITTAQEKFIRDYRNAWEDYYDTTGSKTARSIVEGLTHALVEGGARP